MTLFKLAGILAGIAFIFLSAWWRDDPDAHSYLIFFAGVLLVIGSTKQIVNKEDKP